MVVSEFVEPAYLSLFSCGYGVWIRVNPCGILPIPAFPKSGKEQQYFRICLTMRFRVVFGLFGLSENSSFSSTLRAWFTFAHSSPPTGMTENQSFPIPAFPKSGKEQRSFRICLTMRFRVVFGLFGLSENSSFSSTLRAWFAFAHSSPYRKSNRNDREPIVPYPSLPRVVEGAAVLPKL